MFKFEIGDSVRITANGRKYAGYVVNRSMCPHPAYTVELLDNTESTWIGESMIEPNGKVIGYTSAGR